MRTVSMASWVVLLCACGSAQGTPPASPLASETPPGAADNTGQPQGRAEAGAELEPLDPQPIGEAAGTEATRADGVVRIGWKRDDVPVRIDGMPFAPEAGLGSWAAFKATPDGAMVMGDTVVFQDEVSPAMDAAFENGMEVTALHNHFFYDRPKVYFMHIGGHGEPRELAAAVRAVWDAIREVRARHDEPARSFGAATPVPGPIDVDALSDIIGHSVERKKEGVAKVSIGREGQMGRTSIRGPMGLSSWAAFSGSDELAAMDGDFIMTGDEVQPLLRTLRAWNVHVVALHNHMIGEQPEFYFTHFWAKGASADLAKAFRAALDAQESKEAQPPPKAPRIGTATARSWSFETAETNAVPPDFEEASGRWRIARQVTAPAGRQIVAQTARRRGFNVLLEETEGLADLELRVQLEPVSGKIDQGGGVVWRARDGRNYYIARWNPLEDNYRVYKVVEGKRTQLASADVQTPHEGWHEVRIRMRGDHIECFLDGEKKLDVRDETFSDAGRVGLWTKADARTRFDAMLLRPLGQDED